MPSTSPPVPACCTTGQPHVNNEIGSSSKSSCPSGARSILTTRSRAMHRPHEQSRLIVRPASEEEAQSRRSSPPQCQQCYSQNSTTPRSERFHPVAVSDRTDLYLPQPLQTRTRAWPWRAQSARAERPCPSGERQPENQSPGRRRWVAHTTG